MLYRSDRAPIGLRFGELGDDCQNLEVELRDFSGIVMFLLQLTLDGTGAWYCFRQSSASNPGIFLFALFLLFVTIMMLNLLIAMMTATCDSQIGDSNTRSSAAVVPLTGARV